MAKAKASQNNAKDVETKPPSAPKYTVRAVCPKCKKRTLERVTKLDVHRLGVQLKNRCRDKNCNTLLNMTAIYHKPEGE